MRAVVTLLLALGLSSPAWAELDRAAFVSLGGKVLKVEASKVVGGYSLGSGVVIAADKVVTNCHVTRDADEVFIIYLGVRLRADAQLADVDRDLCILRIPRLQAEPVRLGHAATLHPGESVTALGFTGGIGIQNSPGEVVALHRIRGGPVVQTTNWFSSGASGGGLFNDDLELVGILTFRLRGGAAHYFAAPVEWLREAMRDNEHFLPIVPIDATKLAYWQQPVERQPNFLRASFLEQHKQWKDLEALADSWMLDDDGDPEPWYMRGVACVGLDRLEDAHLALERSVALDPGMSSAWYRLGMVCIGLGLKDRAQQAVAALKSLKNPELADELAKLLASAA